MRSRVFTILFLVGLLGCISLRAQSPIPNNWNAEQIKGTRHISYPVAFGQPYLTDKFISGEIELVGGVVIKDLRLRYSSYRDQLIYYNPEISAQIAIDKISLKGFTLIELSGTKRIFRQLYFKGYDAGNRFFEILDEGETSLVVYRRVVMETCPPYMDVTGKLNNTAYREAYNYYLYLPSGEFEIVHINRKSLLSKFNTAYQKQVKKILRKNRIKIQDETSFVQAWKLIPNKNKELICLLNH